MKHLRINILGLTLAGVGALLGASALQASDGAVSGDSGRLVDSGKSGGETISAQPLRGSAGAQKVSAQPMRQVAAPAKQVEKAQPAVGKDDWLSFEKPVMQAAPMTSQDKVALVAAADSSLVTPGPGYRAVVPGYATQFSAPYSPRQSQVSVGGNFSATQYNSRSTYSGYSSVAGNGYMNVNRYGPGGFPPFQYPYTGYYNNPFTGLSSYSNGYAGAPPTSVPFAGGFFQGRSAFYSQPVLQVPVIPAYTVPVAYPVYVPVRGGCGPGPVYQGGSGLSISAQYRSGG